MPIREPDPELANMSVDDLEQLLADPEGLAGAIEAVDQDESAEQPEAEEAPAEEAPAEEAQEAEAEAPAEVEEAPAAEQSAAEAQAAKPDSELEGPELDRRIMELSLEEADARAKHFERIAGRNTGELGFLRKKIAELEQRRHSPPAVDEGQGTEDYSEPMAPVRSSQATDSVRSWAAERAIKDAHAEFEQTHPGLDDLRSAMMPHVQRLAQEVGLAEAKSTGDPSRVGNLARDILEEAYQVARTESVSKLRSELLSRRARQVPSLKARKIEAGISGSGSSAVSKPKAKTHQDMSLDELEAELVKFER